MSGVSEDYSDLVGSPYWIAPEMIEMATPSTACDIWSVGCTVIELLTGRPPYYNRPPMAALFSMVQDGHPPLPEGFSQTSKDFLLLCFEKEPTMRSTAAVLLNHPWLQKEKSKSRIEFSPVKRLASTVPITNISTRTLNTRILRAFSCPEIPKNFTEIQSSPSQLEVEKQISSSKSCNSKQSLENKDSFMSDLTLKDPDSKSNNFNSIEVSPTRKDIDTPNTNGPSSIFGFKQADDGTLATVQAYAEKGNRPPFKRRDAVNSMLIERVDSFQLPDDDIGSDDGNDSLKPNLLTERRMMPSLMLTELSSLTVMSSSKFYDSDEEASASKEISAINTSNGTDKMSSLTVGDAYTSETLDEKINSPKNTAPAKKLSRQMHDNYAPEILAEYIEEFDRDLLEDLRLTHDEKNGEERRGSKILREALENNRNSWSKRSSLSSIGSDGDKFGKNLHTISNEFMIDYTDGYDLAVELRLRMKRTGLIEDQDFVMMPFSEERSKEVDDKNIEMKRTKEVIAIMSQITADSSEEDVTKCCDKMLYIFNMSPFVKDQLITHFGVSHIMDMFEAVQMQHSYSSISPRSHISYLQESLKDSSQGTYAFLVGLYGNIWYRFFNTLVCNSYK
jgi:hypothetical protein